MATKTDALLLQLGEPLFDHLLIAQFGWLIIHSSRPCLLCLAGWRGRQIRLLDVVAREAMRVLVALAPTQLFGPAVRRILQMLGRLQRSASFDILHGLLDSKIGGVGLRRAGHI